MRSTEVSNWVHGPNHRTLKKRRNQKRSASGIQVCFLRIPPEQNKIFNRGKSLTFAPMLQSTLSPRSYLVQKVRISPCRSGRRLQQKAYLLSSGSRWDVTFRHPPPFAADIDESTHVGIPALWLDLACRKLSGQRETLDATSSASQLRCGHNHHDLAIDPGLAASYFLFRVDRLRGSRTIRLRSRRLF